MSDWYYKMMGEIVGPISGAGMKKRAQAGEIGHATLVRRGSTGEWVSAHRVKGLLDSDPVSETRQLPETNIREGQIERRNAHNRMHSDPKSVSDDALPPRGGESIGAGEFDGAAKNGSRSSASVVLSSVAIVAVLVAGVVWAIRSFSSSDSATSGGRVPGVDGARDVRAGDDSNDRGGGTINPDTFSAVYRAAKELEGSIETGVSRAEFGKFLQRLAAEVSIARDNVRTDSEKKVLQCYSESLEMWKDSATIWDAKLAIPQMREKAKQYYLAFSDDHNDLVHAFARYDFILRLGKLPTQTFPTKDTSDVGLLAKRYGLEVKELPGDVAPGWYFVEHDSFQDIWHQASKKTAEANRMAKAR